MTTGSGRHLHVGACLSLTGRFSRFGGQAARGLAVWGELDGNVDVLVDDDRSDPDRVGACLRSLAGRCDVLLGPYSTQLMRAACRAVPELDLLLWNHGGAGDDIQSALPGRMVSVLSPTSRYAEPFLRHLRRAAPGLPLWLVEGRGSFGRQVARAAESMAGGLGLRTTHLGPADALPRARDEPWALFCAGTFEDDVTVVNEVTGYRIPPELVGAVAAGVRDFGPAVRDPVGVFGVAQWFAGRHEPAALGPPEPQFLATYQRTTGDIPDYPAVQAAAAAALAAHCARATQSTSPTKLWDCATQLQTSTLFGRFRIDQVSGAQLGHEPTLVRWTRSGLVAVADCKITTDSALRA